MSNTDYSDNSKAFFEFINENYSNCYKLLWIVNDVEMRNRLK